jgi:hypothetical protein
VSGCVLRTGIGCAVVSPTLRPRTRVHTWHAAVVSAVQRSAAQRVGADRTQWRPHRPDYCRAHAKPRVRVRANLDHRARGLVKSGLALVLELLGKMLRSFEVVFDPLLLRRRVRTHLRGRCGHSGASTTATGTAHSEDAFKVREPNAKRHVLASMRQPDGQAHARAALRGAQQLRLCGARGSCGS